MVITLLLLTSDIWGILQLTFLNLEKTPLVRPFIELTVLDYVHITMVKLRTNLISF